MHYAAALLKGKATSATTATSTTSTAILLILVLGLGHLATTVHGQCFQDESMNAQWAQLINGDETSTTFSIDGTCCQETVCNVPCAAEVPLPPKGFGIAVITSIVLFVIIGFATSIFVKGESENFFVAGRSLPLWIVVAALTSQAIDSNALLGAATLSYKFQFWDGAVLPLGLGLSLLLNSLLLASKINADNVLTLPDVFAKRYGKLVEVMVSTCTIISFLCLLAGNLVGMGAIISYVVTIPMQGAIWLAAASVLFFTIAGGLFSIAYTDVAQAAIGWTGCMAVSFYMIKNFPSAPPPSIGFPDYIYPDDAACEMYDGVPCSQDASLCCYNTEKWCPDESNCTVDNGAYPIGDQRSFPNQMTDAHSLAPFPNSIVFNWATILVLSFGNLAALDFQQRCIASKTPRIATIGCVISGCLCLALGIPFSYLGSIARVYYGPDSPYATYETDTCHVGLGLPTCAMWVPDEDAILKLFTHQSPAFLGAWGLIAIIAASMSTADGAILALGTVFSHNMVRNIGAFFPVGNTQLVTKKNLLTIARIVSVPMTVISALIASFYPTTGYLLTVAFDVVLASVVVPLLGCFYTKTPRPLAALCAIITGIVVRVVLEFSLPKDGFLIMPFSGTEFLNYGSAASTAFPTYFDKASDEVWDPSVEECQQERYNDWTGIDSLVAPVAAFFVFATVQFLERNGPIFNFSPDGVMAGYLKDTQEVELKEITEDEDISNVTKRESFLSDPSQAAAGGGGGQRHTVTEKDDSGVDNGTAKSAANDDDNDAVPEEFIAYLNEK